VVVGDDIDSGPDGICNTKANNVNLVPVNVPTAAALETYLNDVVWGKQANVFFKVKRKDETVNYDLDRNGLWADPFLVSATDAERKAISDAAKTAGADINIYYVKAVEVPNAITIGTEVFIQDSHANSAENITVHEVGHALGINYESNDPIDVMHSFSSSTNPCNVKKKDWDKVNP